MNKTKIEWVKNPDGSQGYTFNPITGCLNCTPDGMCKGGNFPCYAYRLANGRLRERYLANDNLPFDISDIHTKSKYETIKTDPFYPRFWEDRLAELTRRNDFLWADDIGRGKKTPHGVLQMVMPKGIFLCDMSDWCGIGVPQEWTEKILDEIWGNKGVDRFYTLTKQPQNLAKFSPFPDNCWVGVTITNEAALLKATTNLGYIDAKVKFISFEPLLERLPLPYYQMNCDWLIIGAQTKPYKPPKIEWVQEIVEAADKAGIPVFLKENLKPLLTSNFKGEDVIESHNLWAFKQFKLRQEIPIIQTV